MAANITPEQREELHEAFNVFDKGGGGSIASSDLSACMRQLGQVMSDVEIKEMHQECGGGGEISFDQFLAAIAKMLKPPSNTDAVREAFKVFDKRGSGAVSAKELRNALLNLGNRLTEAEVDEMMKHANVDGAGNINYDAFMKQMMLF